MSHEIEINADGTANAAFARVPAWHRLGTVFPTAMTTEQALAASNLGGWDVHHVPAFGDDAIITPDGVTTVRVADSRHSLAVRTNPVTGALESLGVVGNNYGFVQNEDAAEFMAALLDATGTPHVDTMGSLDGGRRTFMTAKLPDHILVGGVDRIDLYLAILNGFDGNRALTSLLTPIRVVCANTEGAALRNHAQSWKRRHSSRIGASVNEARQTMNMADKYAAAFAAEAERMIQTALTEAEFVKIVAGLFPLDEDAKPRTVTNHTAKVGKIIELWHSDTQASIAGTRWAGYNALTEYSDHYAGVRLPKGATEGQAIDARAANAVSAPYITEKSRYFQALRVPAAAGA